MNNVWTVAFKAPCRGLSFSFSQQCHRPTPIALLGSFAKSIPPIPSRTYNSSSIPREGRACRIRTSSPLWETLHSRSYASQTPLPKPKPKPKKSSKSLSKPSPIVASNPSIAKPQTEQELNTPTDEDVNAASVNLSADQVTEIFGHEISFTRGMQILQELQGRRVSGALSEKGILFPEEDDISNDQALAGLEWLREKFPVDEEAAAAEWAELEAERLSLELEERAKRVGLYKRTDDEYDDSPEPVETPPQPKQVTNVYGESVLAQRQKEIKEKEEAEEKAEEEAKTQEERDRPRPAYAGRDLVLAKSEAIDARRVARREKLAKYEEAGMLPADKILADRSAFSRLASPTIFAVVMIVLSLAFADSYEPPSSTMRMFPTLDPGTATCAGIALINMAVFVLWKRPGMWRILNKYALLSAGHPNTFSVLGSMFSHQKFDHLLSQCAILFLVGLTVHEEVGRGTFLAIYLTAGLSGSLFSLWSHVLARNFMAASVGSSGALLGLAGAYFTLQAWRRLGFKEYSLEYPGLIPLAGMVIWEAVMWRKMGNIVPGVGSGVDHANHLGGLIAGAAIGYYLHLRAEKEKKALMEFNANVDRRSEARSVEVVEP